MDNMLGGEKNIKDINSNPLGIAIKDNTTSISYTKTNKLISALYMVTDIMDKEEPLRNKLRTLGTNIISDIYSMPVGALSKISEIMTFLDIAGVVNLISEMNANILRKEFFELKTAIEESIQILKPSHSGINLSELFRNDFSLPSASFLNEKRRNEEHKGHTRIGVQKGSTLLKALSNVEGMKTLRGVGMPARPIDGSDRKHHADFEVLKGQRRTEILSIIKANSNGATITDIKAKTFGSLISCGEKTLQRELIDMLKDGVLKKTGEKRWSKYFLSN